MTGQHVGSVGDLPPLDEPEDGGARAAMARLTRPTARVYTGGATTGDGDRCPLFPEHGRMIVLTSSQWCPSHEHEPVGGRQMTRAFWPIVGLEAEAKRWRTRDA